MSNASQSPLSEPQSKTQRKVAMHQLQALGERLMTLGDSRLEQLALPERLMDAITETRHITSHSALARQKQYIGKLMRELDPTAIITQLQRWDGTDQEENARFHQLEKLRAALLSDDQALSDYLHRHPGADSQQLRALIRNARRDLAENKPPKSSRELFRLLRTMAETAAPEAP